MKKYGKSTKRGFTLVELIVVLVILAVLAAMLIPALTGYIRRAREEKEYQAASTVYTAVQALATEEYGKHGYPKDSTDIDTSKITIEAIAELTDLEGQLKEVQFEVSGSTVTKVAVLFKDGTKYYTFTPGEKSWDSAETSKWTALNTVVANNTI